MERLFATRFIYESIEWRQGESLRIGILGRTADRDSDCDRVFTKEMMFFCGLVDKSLLWTEKKGREEDVLAKGIEERIEGRIRCGRKGRKGA